jgi:FG-GAP repeat
VGGTGDRGGARAVQAVADAATGGVATGGRSALADFNADGYADLAIGAPGEDGHSGVVNVIYGSATGLSASAAVPDQLWYQGKTDVEGTPNGGDDFGFSLAAT